MCTPSFNLQCLEQCHAILLQRSFSIKVYVTTSSSLILSKHLWSSVNFFFQLAPCGRQSVTFFSPPTFLINPTHDLPLHLGVCVKYPKNVKVLLYVVSIIGLSKHSFSIVCTFHLGPGSYGSIYSNIAIIKSAVFCSYPPYADMHYSLCDGNKSQRKPFI